MRRLWLILAVLLLPLIHGLVQPPVEAASQQVLAHGTSTLANTKLSTATSYSFFDTSSADFDSFVGETIKICNTSNLGLCVQGVIGIKGTGETYGSDLVTNGGFDSTTTGWAVAGGTCTLASAAGGQSGNCLEMTRVSGSAQMAVQNTTISAGLLYRTSAYVRSGSSGNEGYFFRAWNNTGGATIKDIAGTSSESWVQVAHTFATPLGSVSVGLVPIKNSATAGTMLFDTVSLKQVLTPSATGYWIRSLPTSADGNAWSVKSSGFDPNQASGYTWQILSNNPLGRQTAAATGLTSANVHLATVDAGAMVEIVGVDLSPYVGNDSGGTKTIINPRSTSAATMATNPYLLCLYDSAGKSACGYAGAAGAGEALGSDTLAGFNFTSGWTEVSATITDADTFNASGIGTGLIANAVTYATVGALTKGTINATASTRLLSNTGTTTYAISTGSAVSGYKTSDSGGVYLYAGVTGSRDISTLKLERVTDIAVTGLHLHSTANATDRKMARVDSGFSPNQVTSYKVYRVY